MTYPTPRTALQGNPPAPGYHPRKQDIVSVLEQMQAIAATEMLKDFHVTVGDLPAEGNETSDKRVVLATEAEGGGVYRWDGVAWVLVSALPVLLTESISAQEAAASAALAQEWAEAAADNARLEMGTVTTAAPGDPADATITGDPGDQELNLTIPRGADGWSPLLAIVSDGDRRVMQIADWAGGEGVPPATGDYLGVSGLVSDIAQAIDIRGPEGAVDGAGEFGEDLIATDTAVEARALLNVAAIALVGLGGQTADIDPDAAGLVTRFVRFVGANAPGGSGSWHGIHISRALDQQSAQIAVRDTSDSNPPQMAIRHRHGTGDWSPWAFVRTSAELIEAAGLGLSGPGLLGRSGAGAGVAERIEVGAGLELDEGVLSVARHQMILAHEEPENSVGGGTATAGSWEIRKLNAILHNSIPDASLASNTITLPAGEYVISARGLYYRVAAFMSKLRKVSGTAEDMLIGTVGFVVSSSAGSGTPSFIAGRFSIAESADFQVQHRVTASRSTDGYGPADSTSFDVAKRFALVVIEKVG